MNFGEKIKHHRKLKKLSGEELGRMVDATKTAVSYWENGKTKSLPAYETITKLSKALGVSTEYLTGNETNIESSNLNRNVVRINVLGSVPAGVPIEAIEDIVDWEEIPAEWLKTGEYFGLRINGDSMSPKYLDGDTIILKKQPTIDSGQEAVVYVNGYDATFKKVIINEDESIILQPLNPEHAPYSVPKNESFSVAGVPVELRRKI